MATFKGIAFPFKKGKTELPDQAFDADLIQMSIAQILLTERGERVMRPTFGASLMSKVFENNDDVLKSVLQAEVISAISTYENRAIIQSVDVDQSVENQALVTVKFIILANRQPGSVTLNVSTLT